jgi:L-cysteine:1D-myo-inositol 2-amino-2-deoxy-alpha-D-glucopyranoside ligase
MSTAHGTALTGRPYAVHHTHTGMVGYQGEKMSKSLGNLVKVSELVAAGHDPRAVRLALLAHHYRSDWEWFDAELAAAEQRLGRWVAWAATSEGGAVAVTAPTPLVVGLRSYLADDLDTPSALDAVDAVVSRGTAPSEVDVDAVQALLGIDLRA